MLVVVALALVGSVYTLWLPQFRVQEVAASGPNAEAISSIAQAQLTGTYALIVPKNSILFIPREPIRNAVLAEFPDVADVEIARASFTALDVTVTPRAKAFIWCGTSFATPYPDGVCFEADGGGLIYRMSGITVDAASTTTPTVVTTQNGVPVSDLRIYSPLDTELAEGQSPVGTRVSKAAAMPDVLKLVEAINSLNVPIVAITLRDDEADLWVNDATRITYVVGREPSAAKLAESVIPTLNLTDGTIQYLDLRFNGKAYLKRYGE
jgi:hypothetical protein